MTRLSAALLILACFVPSALAGEAGAPKVYLDCRDCDFDHVRREVDFVNYVRDRSDADIHVQSSSQVTGASGRQYTLTFLGRNAFAAMSDTLQYTTLESDTREQRREKMLGTFRLGLVPFLARTSLAEHLTVSYAAPQEETSVDDPWDYWFFNIGLNGWLSGESSSRSSHFWSNFSANRTTPEWKSEGGLYFSYSENIFHLDDFDSSIYSHNLGFHELLVKSLGEHWGIGGMVGLNTSTFSNRDLQIYAAPAVEYNFFPYSESSRQELKLRYKIAMSWNDYTERTIYDKTSEFLSNHGLVAKLGLIRPWGSSYIELEGSHFLHDAALMHLRLSGNLSWKLFGGLSLSLNGQIAMIRDQLSLSAAAASTEEIILKRRQLAKDYDYHASIGLNYAFGSIYNNVVNSRF